jgi:hypothetical protein
MLRYILIIALHMIPWGCHSIVSSDWEDSALVTSVQTDGIQYTLTVKKLDFEVVDTLVGSFQVLNASVRPRTFSFANIQQFGFDLVDRHGNITVHSPNIVQPATSEFTLLTGESKTFIIRSVFRDLDGEYIQPGEYQLVAFLLDANSPRVRCRINVRQINIPNT